MKRAANHSQIFGGKTLAGTFAIHAHVSFMCVACSEAVKKKKKFFEFFTDDSIEH